MDSKSEAEVLSLLAEVWADIRQAEFVWQAATIVVAIGLGLLAMRLVARWIGRQQQAGRIGENALGVGAAKRLLWPIVAMLVLVAARPILAHHHPVSLLTLAIALLGWLAVVRGVLYGLRSALPNSSFLSAFERSIATLIWLTFALHVTGLLRDVAAFFESIVLPVGKQTISLWTVLTGSVWVLATLLLALWLGTVVDRRLMGATTLNSSLRVALSRLARALLVLVAVLVSLNLVGIDLTVLSVFGGALGVGLGFGLQKIASNYMSGFIVLFDRSVRIGDLVSIENFNGQVRDITTRYTVIRSMDGREAIVPNEKLITETVLNHSFSDPQVRVAVQVQVAYATDLDVVLRLLESVAREHPRTMDAPAPLAIVTGFADSGINLEVGIWIRDPENGTGLVRSDICVGIWKAFRREGIEIPFPQRDIRVHAQPIPGESGPSDLIHVTPVRQDPVSGAGNPLESGSSAATRPVAPAG